MAVLTSAYQYIGRSNAVFNYGGTYYYYLLLYAKTSGSAATGKHTVSVKLRLACSYDVYFNGYSTTGSATVAGTSAISWSAQPVPNGTWSSNLTEGGVTYPRWIDLGEGTAEVNTGYGAAKDVTLAAAFQRLDMASPPAYVPKTTAMSISATVTLPAIASASVPTVSAASVVMGNSVTITTNRQSSAFTHSLTYAFGGSTGTIATGVGAAYTWTVPDLVSKIPNATSGSCTVTCKTYSGSVLIGTSTCTLTLRVPAASVPTLSASSVVMGGSVTLQTNRRSTGFTHYVTYVFGSASGVIKTGVTDSCQWDADNGLTLELAKQVPNGASGVGSITCATYNGTALIGSASVDITLKVPDNSNTKPSVSMTLSPVSDLGTAFAGLYIQNLTKVDGELSATGKYGASIRSCQMVIGSSVYGSPYTSGYLTQTGDVTVTGKAADSRGYVGTTAKTITVIPYSKPAILPATGQKDVLCGRCDENGSFTDSGTYLRIVAKRSYSTVTSGGVQYNYCYIRYRINGGDWVKILSRSASGNEVDTGAISGVSLALTTTYTVEIGVVDDIGNTASVTKIVPTDKVDVHLREGGGGFALGGYSTKAGFECAMPAFFTGTVQGPVMGRYLATSGVNVLYYAGLACLGKYNNTGLILIVDTGAPANHIFAYYSYRHDELIRFVKLSSSGLSVVYNDVGTVSVSGNTGTVQYIVMPCF